MRRRALGVIDRPSTFPETPGYPFPKAEVPEYRWVPPAGAPTALPVAFAPWGIVRGGPAYQSPPERGCSACMRGYGADPTPEQIATSRAEFKAPVTPWLLLGVVALGLGAYYLYDSRG